MTEQELEALITVTCSVCKRSVKARLMVPNHGFCIGCRYRWILGPSHAIDLKDDQ